MRKLIKLKGSWYTSGAFFNELTFYGSSGISGETINYLSLSDVTPVGVYYHEKPYSLIMSAFKRLIRLKAISSGVTKVILKTAVSIKLAYNVNAIALHMHTAA